jgi:gliding motility-associated-like protein
LPTHLKILLITGLLFLGFNPDAFVQIDSVCIGDNGMVHQESKTPYQSLFVWTVEGEEDGDVEVVRYNDSIAVNWQRSSGYYSITVQEIFVFSAGPNDTLAMCEGVPVTDSVLVRGIEDMTIIGEQEICEGDITTLEPDNAFSAYLWSDGSTDMRHPVNTQGAVWLRVTDQYGCTAEDTIEVIVHPSPVVDLGPDTNFCSLQPLVLDAGWDGVYYDWSTGETTREIAPSASDTGLVFVTVENEYGCISSDTIWLLPCDNNNIPTVFTPNDDGYHDTWRIGIIENDRGRFSETVIEIFDRWGRLVYRSERGYGTPWDGRNMRGKQLPMGSYFYVIEMNNGQKQITGNVTIVR